MFLGSTLVTLGLLFIGIGGCFCPNVIINYISKVLGSILGPFFKNPKINTKGSIAVCSGRRGRQFERTLVGPNETFVLD